MNSLVTKSRFIYKSWTLKPNSNITKNSKLQTYFFHIKNAMNPPKSSKKIPNSEPTFKLGLTPTLQWKVVVASIALCNKNWKSRVCGHLFNHFPCKSLFRKFFLKKHVQMFRYSSTFKKFKVRFWVGKPEFDWVQPYNF